MTASFTCPIVVGGQRCGVEIPAKHWACRRCWLLFPRRFLCNSNRYKRGTAAYAAMVARANKLLASDDSDDLRPPWRR